MIAVGVEKQKKAPLQPSKPFTRIISDISPVVTRASCFSITSKSWFFTASVLIVWILLPETFGFGVKYPQKRAHASFVREYQSSIRVPTRMNSENEPIWCPEQQIYLGGTVPTNEQYQTLLDTLKQNPSQPLRIFGYGSLCWKPGEGSILSHERVTIELGTALGWKRCWSQKSCDHRGTPAFPGLVCTLISDDEIAVLEGNKRTHLTEGLVYNVPSDLVEECLAELDFREKGGYSRDVIEVRLRDDSSKGSGDGGNENVVQTLLYRGTPENPAFWKRALIDLSFAAATMTRAVGPSGPNVDYLFNLDQFLSKVANDTTSNVSINDGIVGDVDTRILASMVRELQTQESTNNAGLYFLFGSGSNQYNQLLLRQSTKNDERQHAETDASGEGDVDKLTEIILLAASARDHQTSKSVLPSIPRALYAGGGHSALLTQNNRLYLWGWNDYGQLGHVLISAQTASPIPYLQKEDGTPMEVQNAALGHSHTLILEKSTRNVYAFGENNRGQCGILTNSQDNDASSTSFPIPVIPHQLKDVQCQSISAGVFHSLVITLTGYCISFGSSNFHQSNFGNPSAIIPPSNTAKVCTGWKPPDTKLVKAAAGQRHTLLLDEEGTVYTIGDNKHGQRGTVQSNRQDLIPTQVNLTNVVDIDCGWSHCIAAVRAVDGNGVAADIRLYGWGRNDKGQLGLGHFQPVKEPTPLVIFPEDTQQPKIRSWSCGSECTMILTEDGTVYGTGWNEHGNLGIGSDVKVEENVNRFTKIRGAQMPKLQEGQIMAAGGGQFITMLI